MNILIISASMNEPSNSDYLADVFGNELQQQPNTTVDKLRLKDLQIDHFTLDHYKEDYQHEPDFQKLQQLVEQAHGLVIATPVWNFGVPAQLKNMIDRFGSFALNETHSRGTLGGKPFYCIFTGGAPEPAWKGIMKKTTSFVIEGLRYFKASPVGSFFEGKCTKGRGVFGLVVDERPETHEKLRAEARKFAAIVQTFEETGQPPAKQAFVSWVMGLGEKILKKVF